MQLQEDKIRALQEKLELSDQKLAQYANLPDVEQELKQRMEALHQVTYNMVGTRPRGGVLHGPISADLVLYELVLFVVIVY